MHIGGQLSININEIEPDSFIISNKNGRKFSCHLPELEKISLGEDVEEEDEKMGDTEQHTEHQSVEEGQAEPLDDNNKDKSSKLTELLAAINKIDVIAKPIKGELRRYKNTPGEAFLEEFPRQDCIYHSTNGDWWSYEICLNRYIRQFHWGQDKIPKQISIIGIFDSDFDWDKEPNEALDQPHFVDFKKYDNKNVHLQYYKYGDTCDVTNKPREAKLIYKCVDRSWFTHRVVDMQEPSTCSYEITIHSPGVCSTIKEDQNNISSKVSVNSLIIQCSKVLSQEEYTLWSEVREKARIEQESKTDDLFLDFIEKTREMADHRYKKVTEKNEDSVTTDSPVKSAQPINEGSTTTKSGLGGGIKDLKSKLTAKGIEALSNFVSKSFNHAVEEDVDDMEIIFHGGADMTEEEIAALKEAVKKTKNLQKKSEKETSSSNSSIQKELTKIDQEKQLDDAGQDASLKSENKNSAKENQITFIDGNNENLNMNDKDSRISDQLKAIHKAIENDLREAGDEEGEAKLAGLSNIKIQIMDENGQVHSAQDISEKVDKLPESVLQEIKSAVLKAIAKPEKREKSLAAENDYTDLSSSYNEDFDIFEGSEGDGTDVYDHKDEL